MLLLGENKDERDISSKAMEPDFLAKLAMLGYRHFTQSSIRRYAFRVNRDRAQEIGDTLTVETRIIAALFYIKFESEYYPSLLRYQPEKFSSIDFGEWITQKGLAAVDSR